MEEAAPQHPAKHEVGMALDALSVEELQDRIGLLEAEILRLRATMAAKGDSRKAAEAAFKL
ncbi:DUF1192 domain-containing protein [Devosia sp. YIM 151766]|uniref:DUF1192 domain-containing protein n=1 Tax=Devosia sp. YIM 151766 TaxID=3017325 RepID=UPI00255CE82F|nr:DUF1192 domain-containing protein [Devosia sp. YIM 151766]WIY52303.1 DUF1192 domain-containing protein [Devosia sp. YIM 151766]